jgi:hypothetical protein
MGKAAPVNEFDYDCWCYMTWCVSVILHTTGTLILIVKPAGEPPLALGYDL